MTTTFVSLKAVDQGYGSHKIIEDFSLELGRGVFGLLGPNGAGKTTLIRTLATLHPPQRGEICVNGVTLQSEKDARLARRGLGYLGQSFGYPKHFTALDFVTYCLWLRGHSHPDSKVAMDSLVRTGMAENANTRMKNLSGGMRQRVGISSAIAGSPTLILLDEPTVGLDPAQRLQFRKLIRKLSDNSCIVLSTHLIEDVAAACDSVVVMATGEIKFSGRPEDLEKRSTTSAPGDSALEKGYMSVLDAEGKW